MAFRKLHRQSVIVDASGAVRLRDDAFGPGKPAVHEGPLRAVEGEIFDGYDGAPVCRRV